METWEKGRGILFVLSAPSGTGKTSLAKFAVANIPTLAHSVSYTTRPLRKGEVDGVSYHFIGGVEFERMIKDGRFAEYAPVHGFHYGTSMDSLGEARRNGNDLLLAIDVQGAAVLRKSPHIDCVFIFVLPPSLKELRKRLKGRGREDGDEIEKRVDEARKELDRCIDYDYLIINDDLKRAQDDLMCLIRAERLKARRSSPEFPDYSLPLCEWGER